MKILYESAGRGGVTVSVTLSGVTFQGDVSHAEAVEEAASILVAAGVSEATFSDGCLREGAPS